MIYLNNSSTTKPTNEVLQDFMWCTKNCWANPSDISTDGIRAKQIIKRAQEQIANYIGAKPNEIIFTSGASESNNWAIKGYVDRYPGVKNIITTEIEHPSVYNTCKYLKNKGYNVKYAPIDETGQVMVNKLESLIGDNNLLYPLTSIMMANNEIGTVNTITAIAEIIHNYGGILHVDAVQAFEHIPINVEKMGIDMMSVSFHKFGGFKNCGFLYIKEGINLTPLIHGGHQFDGRRAGTENVPMIYAMGNQVERINNKYYPLGTIRNYLYDKIYELCYDLDVELRANGSFLWRLPHLLSLTFKGFSAEALITLLDMQGICVSAGSACSSGTKTPSRILKAIGLSDEDAFSTIRISVGEDTTIEECDVFVKTLRECLESLKMIE